MHPGARIARTISALVIAVVVMAACLSAAVAVPQPAPRGSVAAPAVRVVDVHATPSPTRAAAHQLVKFAGWIAGAARFAVLLGAASLALGALDAARLNTGLLFSPLRV